MRLRLGFVSTFSQKKEREKEKEMLTNQKA